MQLILVKEIVCLYSNVIVHDLFKPQPNIDTAHFCLVLLPQGNNIFADTVSKAYNAADFSEINELADDEEVNYKRGLKFLSGKSKGMVTCDGN